MKSAQVELRSGRVSAPGAGCGHERRGARRQGLTHIPIFAQLELTSPLPAQLKPTLSPI